MEMETIPIAFALPPAKCWKRIKTDRRRECIKLYALIFAKQKSPRSYPIRGPQQPEGNLDNPGAGSMNCWGQKLTAGMRATGRSGTSEWDVAGSSHPPPIPHLSYRVWTGLHS